MRVKRGKQNRRIAVMMIHCDAKLIFNSEREKEIFTGHFCPGFLLSTSYYSYYLLPLISLWQSSSINASTAVVFSIITAWRYNILFIIDNQLCIYLRS